MGGGARKTHQRPWSFFWGGSLFINNSDESLNRLCHWEDETSYEHGTFFFLWGGCGGQCFRHAKENTADASAEAVPGNHEVWR